MQPPCAEADHATTDVEQKASYIRSQLKPLPNRVIGDVMITVSQQQSHPFMEPVFQAHTSSTVRTRQMRLPVDGTVQQSEKNDGRQEA